MTFYIFYFDACPPKGFNPTMQMHISSEHSHQLSFNLIWFNIHVVFLFLFGRSEK